MVIIPSLLFSFSLKKKKQERFLSLKIAQQAFAQKTSCGTKKRKPKQLGWLTRQCTMKSNSFANILRSFAFFHKTTLVEPGAFLSGGYLECNTTIADFKQNLTCTVDEKLYKAITLDAFSGIRRNYYFQRLKNQLSLSSQYSQQRSAIITKKWELFTNMNSRVRLILLLPLRLTTRHHRPCPKAHTRDTKS